MGKQRIAQQIGLDEPVLRGGPQQGSKPSDEVNEDSAGVARARLQKPVERQRFRMLSAARAFVARLVVSFSFFLSFFFCFFFFFAEQSNPGARLYQGLEPEKIFLPP